MSNNQGAIQMGVVNSYDPVTMTAEVTAFDGSARYYNVGTMMQSCDLGNGVYSFTPPSIGSPCLFTKISGETVILGQYAPPNLGDNGGLSSSIGSTMNRATDEMPNQEHLPGDWIITSQSGAEVFLRNMLFSIKMSPIFYSTWNLVNSVWDTMCNIFKFSSPAADVLVDVDASSNTNVSIQVRRNAGTRDGIPSVDLQIGNNAGVINLKINGQDFCHIDAERNVNLVCKNVSMNFEDMTFTGNTLDMLGVNDVKLP